MCLHTGIAHVNGATNNDTCQYFLLRIIVIRFSIFEGICLNLIAGFSHHTNAF